MGVLVDHAQHDIGDFRVKLRALSLFDFCPYLFLRHDFPVNPVGGHGVVGIRNSYDSRHFRNIFSRQSVGITVPVKSLVMPFCALGDQGDLVQVP